MALEFLLPDIGEGLMEATIVSWRAGVGERIGRDEPVVEVETDKAVVEIPAPRAGVVLAHGRDVGATITVGSMLVVIGEEGESWDATATSQAPHKEPSPIVGNLQDPADVTSAPTRPAALPLIRRLAESLGVDLGSVSGSGPGGRILREDVEAAAARLGDSERVPLSATRLAISRHLSRSWQEIPHVTTFGTADPSALFEARRGAAEPIPLDALLVAVSATLLVEFPEFNATLDRDHLLLHKHRHIGFAVDTADGLLVAVIRDADQFDVGELGQEVRRLSASARERTLSPDEARGATFTVSNIGALGGGFGTPIIPLGTTAILSVGRAEDRPVVKDGDIVIGQRMPISLSYDHRVIDGAKGRAFLAAFVTAAEQFSV